MPESKKSGGNRKHGRTGRSPSHIRYNSEGRCRRNKERRVAKEARRQARLKVRRHEIEKMRS